MGLSLVKMFVVAFVFLALGIGMGYYLGYDVGQKYTKKAPSEIRYPFETPLEEVACARDVKNCADGSYVVRISPTCEFALCPEEMDLEPSF